MLHLNTTHIRYRTLSHRIHYFELILACFTSGKKAQPQFLLCAEGRREIAVFVCSVQLKVYLLLSDGRLQETKETKDELSGLVKTHFTKQHVFSLKKEEHCNYLVRRW